MVNVELKPLLGRLNRFCTSALEGAIGSCISRTHYEVTVEHLFGRMLEVPSCDLGQVLKHFEVDLARAGRAVQGILEEFRTGSSGKPVFSPQLLELFQEAWLLASIEHGLAEIRSGMLLRAFLANPDRFTSEELAEVFAGIRRDELKTRYGELVKDSTEGKAQFEKEPAREPGKAPPADGSALEKFTVDFTARAKKGEIDPVFGRDREIRQMVDILARRRKNNPIVVGEAGVGKTAVVEGLAVLVAEGDVPDVLRDVRILSLDMGLLQAGAGVKGEFENRLKSVIAEVKASPKPTILFIDEAHTLIGAGGATGGSDAANLLKPALARGELRTIAATTWSEYKKYFEKDAALARRFQPIKLEEPDEEAVVTMLRGLRQRYEEAHGVVIRDEALVAAARLGSRYISGRQQPDKGVDLMDTASARVKIALTSKPDVLQDVERRIQTMERELTIQRRDRTSGAAGKEPRIAELEETIRKSGEERKSLEERWKKEKTAAEKVLQVRKSLDAGTEGKPEEPKAGPSATPATAAKAEPKSAAAKAEDSRAKGAKATGSDLPGKDGEALRKELETALAGLREIQGKNPLLPVEVDSEVVARVVSDWTGIPLGKMVRDDAQSILQFEENLRRRIRGQDHVLEVVGKGIRAAKAGLKDPRQPMGCFLFVGPSGVGKTECALGVADLLFGGERYMTTINMSEFQEKHTVSRLIGSPPGYVGFGEGGVLTEAIRQRPYSVVLLDEVEKADREVMNLFYQVFDKGMLSDGEGREVDFKDTVIFMTSNLASEEIIEASQGGKPDAEELASAIRPILSHHFKPALLARMTVVPFYPIGADAMKEIAGLKLGRLAARLKESHRVTLDVDPKVIDVIVSRCTEVETGARNVDHILSSTVLPLVSSEILQRMSAGPLPDRMSLKVDDKGGFAVGFGK